MKCTEKYVMPNSLEIIECENEGMADTNICMLHAENIRIRLQLADFAGELARLRLKTDNTMQYVMDRSRNG